MKRSNATSKHKSDAEQVPVFTVEIPLVAGPRETRILNVRLDHAARSLYNACLGQALRRMERCRQSKAFQQARALEPRIRMLHRKESEGKLTPEESEELRHLKEERNDLYRKAREQNGFTHTAIQRFAVIIRRNAFNRFLDVHVAQKLASRAYKAVDEYLMGRRGRPRFKGRRQLDTVEGKSNHAGIRWKGDRVEWLGLVLYAVIDLRDPVIHHGLFLSEDEKKAAGIDPSTEVPRKVKYVRLVRRKIRGRDRFYVQLIVEGRPYRKPKNHIGNGTVGIDAGPSIIARVSENEARLDRFCDELQTKEREIRKLKRKMDRSRRAGNPQNYNPDGTIKKGPLRWKYSKTYLKDRSKLGELYRRIAAHRRSLIGRMVNETLRMGNVFKYEKLPYRVLQRMFGKSISSRAPGMYFRELARKAESAGGKILEIPIRLGLSSTCHCGKRRKKKLSQRVHRCSCGVICHRDLYSAYLARFVECTRQGKFFLDADSAARQWSGAEPLLQAEFQPPSACRYVMGSPDGTEGVAAKEGIAGAEARDAVAGNRESPGEAEVVLLRTPGL